MGRLKLAQIADNTRFGSESSSGSLKRQFGVGARDLRARFVGFDRVNGCRCDYVSTTSDVPQTADDLSRRPTRQPWANKRHSRSKLRRFGIQTANVRPDR
jgi:hypothetical protein